MQDLSPAERREFRARAHHLHPVVSIAANGLTLSVLKEIDNALKSHELIKIRVYGDDRELRLGYLEQVCTELRCAEVQAIGKLLIVYRFNPELHQPKQAPEPSKPRRKKTTVVPGLNLRPGRPTTTNAPRKSLAGAPEPRYRKPSAGSARTRKSAR